MNSTIARVFAIIYHVLPSSTSPALPASAGVVFDLLRRHGPLSRSEIGTACGLSRPTVTSRVDRLLDAGLVEERALVTDRGRPPGQLCWNPSAGVVVGIDLDRAAAHVVVADLSGRPLALKATSVSMSDGPSHTIDSVLATAHHLLDALGRSLSEVWCVGVGVPAPVDRASGQLINPAGMASWAGASLRALVHEHWAVDVVADNDMRMLAAGEAATRTADRDDFVLVKLGMGVGGAIVSDGVVLRGRRGAAGEIGHVSVPGLDRLCRCGRSGCLETIASGWALLEAFQSHGHDVEDLADVVALVEAGEPFALRALRDAGRALGELLGVVVNLLNPGAIVISGELAAAGEPLLAGVREILHQRVTPVAGAQLTVERGGGDPFAGALGAVHSALAASLSASTVDAFLDAGSSKTA